VAVSGLIVAVLGWLAAMVAPKVPPDGVFDEGAWITPDDYSVQPWTAVMFVAGLVLVLVGLSADGLADSNGWSDPAALGVVCAVLGALVAWGFLIWAASQRKRSRTGSNR
jgi:protein-S-isoprenylcysteine O-methyltransferase Ste14